MGIWNRKKDAGDPPPKGFVAAAMPLSGPGVATSNSMRQTQSVEAWQKDAWYFYDVEGALYGPVNYIANAISQATPYAAEVDPDTGIVAGPTENETVQRVASALLGGAARRSQLLHTIAVCWQVPGESFIVIRSRARLGGQARPDEWLVLSGQKVKVRGDTWTYVDPFTGLTEDVVPRRDVLIRCWSPHPNDQAKADSAVRRAIPPLREIEKASMSIAARLDSRLIANGIQLVPAELDFPTADGQSVGAAFTDYLFRAFEAAIANPGSATAATPIGVTVPAELIPVFKEGFIDLATEFSSQLVELRSDARRTVADTLDIPRSVADGSMAEANHWSSWQVEETTYKIYIEPLLQRFSDAVGQYWFHPALKAMGVQDPDRYVIDWDTSAIVKRPDATEDLDHLYDLDLISDDYRRAQSGIPDDAIPSEDEANARFLRKLVMADPSLLSDPAYAEILGLPVASTPDAAEPTAAPPAVEAPAGQRELPATQGQEPDAEDVPAGLTAAAELLVFDALSRAGSRLLTAKSRGQYPNTPKHELHTVLASAGPADNLLADSFLWTDGVAEAFGVDRVRFASVLFSFARDRIESRTPYRREDLVAALGRLR